MLSTSSLVILSQTKELWFPALKSIISQFSATGTGRMIEQRIKDQLKWLKDPEAERAFQDAFQEGIRRFEQHHGRKKAAQTVARVLIHIAKNDPSGEGRAEVLRQVFSEELDPTSLAEIVRQDIFAIEGNLVQAKTLTPMLEILLRNYLRPAFLENQYFAERVGFVEVVSLLRDISQARATPPIDLDQLRTEYFQKLADRYEFLTMQGISPKVQNRTIGIHMRDVFIPLVLSQSAYQFAWSEAKSAFDVLIRNAVERANKPFDKETLEDLSHAVGQWHIEREHAGHSEQIFFRGHLKSRLLELDWGYESKTIPQ